MLKSRKESSTFSNIFLIRFKTWKNKNNKNKTKEAVLIFKLEV